MFGKVRVTDAQKAEAVLLYASGKALKAVCKETGLSAPLIRYLVAEAGVRRPWGGFQPGNPSRTGRPHSAETVEKCRRAKDHVRGNPLRQYFKLYERNARVGSRNFSLTEDQFAQLAQRPCHYCGQEPVPRRVNSHQILVNGIDRVDNTKGYTPENCVPACGPCNMMKGNLSASAFIERCRSVAKHAK
jgi:transposase-like protein